MRFAGLVLVAILLAVVARAETVSTFGLSAEAGVRVDDLIVRRVRDPGTGALCYVAQTYAFSAAPHGRVVAIDCLLGKAGAP